MLPDETTWSYSGLPSTCGAVMIDSKAAGGGVSSYK